MPKLILAVVLIVCVGAVMGLMGWALTKKQTRLKMPEVKTTDEIVEDETDDWQTYRNEEFGFEVKYPEDLGLFFLTHEIFLISEKINSLDKYFLLSVFDNINNLSINEYIEKEIPKEKGPYSQPIVEVTEIENYINNNINGKKVTIKFDTRGYINIQQRVILNKGNFLYTIFLPKDVSEKLSESQLKTANQILSTFKFIEKEDTSDWQTYRNKLWGIEFKYPSDREISIRDLEGQINISVYTNKKLNYTNNLYFNPAAIDSENIVDFESLKNYLNNNNPDGDIIIFENKNGINFYKVITETNTSSYAYYYAFYNGKKPFNIIKFHHRLDDHMKPDNKELFENIINNFSFIEIDEEMAEAFFKKKQINPECAGWYAANEYRGKNHLKNLSEIENIVEKNGYSLFNDGEVNFYFPKNWEVKIDEYDDNKKWYKIYYLDYSYFSMATDDIENFKNDYKMCINRCFSDADPASPFSWKAMSCSENYTEENLEKFLLGNYINYLSTGSLPPGGEGLFIYSKAYKDIIISASYSSGDFQDYPKAKEIRNNFSKSQKDASEDEKKIISDEIDYYEQEFYKIIKSFEILK